VFVNDGSTDKTLEVLEKLRIGHEDHISIYDCEKKWPVKKTELVGNATFGKTKSI
jgi:glycosyltransferase involved in cell wall biosynthesis